MKKFFRFIVSLVLGLLVLASIGWYLFSYDRDFTRDTLLSQARFHDEHGNSRMSSWFYDLAYNFSGQDEHVAIELAEQYKADGNFTKAEYTLSNAINDDASPDLYIALCKTYVEQDKLLDAVSLLANIADPEMRAQLDAMRAQYPASPIVVHPECPVEVTARADAALSTGGMLKYVQENPAKSFVIGTEAGIIHRLRKENPDKQFYALAPAPRCPNMKKISLESILKALETMTPAVELPAALIERARQPIDRMLAAK